MDYSRQVDRIHWTIVAAAREILQPANGQAGVAHDARQQAQAFAIGGRKICPVRSTSTFSRQRSDCCSVTIQQNYLWFLLMFLLSLLVLAST
jgi:hypothetical protein